MALSAPGTGKLVQCVRGRSAIGSCTHDVIGSEGQKARAAWLAAKAVVVKPVAAAVTLDVKLCIVTCWGDIKVRVQDCQGPKRVRFPQ